MNQFYKTYKKEIFLFLLMFTLELAMIFALSQINGIGIFSRNDANEFQNIVRNLINRHTFSLDSEPPFLPTNFRTPGYPLFLSIIYLIFSSFKPAIFIGAAIFALSAPLVYLIAKEIFSERIAFWSSVLFAIEPWAIFQSGFLVAEQIFIPIFLFSVYLFSRYLESERTHYLYWASLFLGATTLIRPLVTFFIIIFIFFAFIYEFKISAVRALRVSLLSFLVFLTILAPWLARNKIVLDTWQVSSISNVNLFIENYAMLEKYLGKMKPDEDINEVARILLGTKNYGEAKRIENAKILAGIALKEIKENISSYVIMHIRALPGFLTRNSYGNIFFDLKMPGANIQSNISRHILSRDFKGLFELMKTMPVSSKILVALAFFWPLIIVLTIVGIFAKFRDDPRNLTFWFLILWIGYFLVFTGNLRDISRYKLAINAPLFMLAVFGFSKIYNFLNIRGN